MKYNIFLEKKTGDNVFSVFLDTGYKRLCIGYYYLTEKIFYCQRSRDKHVFKKTDSLAFNFDFVINYEINLLIANLDGTKLYIAKNVLLDKGHTHACAKAERQIFLPLSEFSRTKEEAINRGRQSKQLDLFN